jgi:hypothetical protein
MPTLTRGPSSAWGSVEPPIEGDRTAITHGNVVDLYALPSGHLLRRIEHAAPVSAVAFAPVPADDEHPAAPRRRQIALGLGARFRSPPQRGRKDGRTRSLAASIQSQG